MDFSVEEEDAADKEEDEERGSRSADNDILSELQMKQYEIAAKKDGLLSTEKNSVDDQDHRSTSQPEA